MQNDKVRLEVLQAYSDCNEQNKGERNLKFKASEPVGGEALISIMKEAVLVGYNEFSEKSTKHLVSVFGENAQYTIAREGSVCIYVKPAKGERTSIDGFCAGDYDECSIEDDGLLRLWWD